MNANLIKKVIRTAISLLVLGMLIALTAGTASAAGGPPPTNIDLGSGYWLVDGKIVTEKDLSSAGFVPVTGIGTYEKLDLGSGYWLVDGKVISEKDLTGQGFVPVTGLRAPLNAIDIGSGCWLVLGPDGWQMIPSDD